MKNIKPSQIALLGLVIIVLGILIPSFFINAFSTMGLSVIIGLVIIVSAYILFSINTIKSKGSRTIRWLLLPVIIVLLVSVGFYINHSYQQNQKNKIYTVNETVKMPGFDFKVLKAEYSEVPIDTRGIDLNDRKDCSKVPEEEKHDCDWYNWPRRNAQNYLNEYTRATVSYEVTADKVVDGKKLSVNILPDSGRELNYNTGSDSYDDLYSFTWELNIDYTANPKSDFGGNVNSGITRKGSIGADLKNSEQVFDVVVSYEGETRTIRLNR